MCKFADLLTIRNVNNKSLVLKMRTKILKEAFELISKKSVKDVSMREIAEACNITKPSLYYYFKDKDELCYIIMQYVIEKQNNDVQKYIDSGMPFEEILFDIFNKSYKMQGRKYLSFFLHFKDYVISNKKLEKRVEGLKKVSNKKLKELFKIEVDKKNITLKNAEIGYSLVRACVHDIVFKAKEIDKNYPKDITKAILKAIEYKSEKV